MLLRTRGSQHFLPFSSELASSSFLSSLKLLYQVLLRNYGTLQFDDFQGLFRMERHEKFIGLIRTYSRIIGEGVESMYM